jgi:hypothetical protein
MKPTIGRIVHYTLTSTDADAINRRRKDARTSLRQQSEAGVTLLTGFVLHTGNDAWEGEVYPAMIVRVFPALDVAPEAVNLQVFLDGNDTYWATSRYEGHGFGHWAWPTRD